LPGSFHETLNQFIVVNINFQLTSLTIAMLVITQTSTDFLDSNNGDNNNAEYLGLLCYIRR